MSSRLIEKPLKVGKTDSYSLTVSSAWLAGEEIASFTPTINAANATIGSITIGTVNSTNDTMFVFLTGVAAGQNVELHFDYTTATRSDCDFALINVEEC